MRLSDLIEPARLWANRSYRARVDRWEEALCSAATNRVVRPFEWGVEWAEDWPTAARVPKDGLDPLQHLNRINESAVAFSDEFYGYRPPSDFRLKEDILTFTSAVPTPHPENNLVHARWFPASLKPRSAVLILPHWNAKEHEYGKLCEALQFLGLSALRLSLPYHDRRMPPELQRADYAVSPNVARTIDSARQAVADIRSCLDWLETQGCRRFGVVGTSLGSCYAFLASAHDSRLEVNVFNLFSLYFADAVWTGRTTRHLRDGLEGNISLDSLRQAWMAITPLSYVGQFARFKKTSLFLHANYDTTFLPQYSRAMLEEIRLRNLEHKSVVLPCGHYTIGRFPFQYVAGYQIINFLKRSL